MTRRIGTYDNGYIFKGGTACFGIRREYKDDKRIATIVECIVQMYF